MHFHLVSGVSMRWLSRFSRKAPSAPVSLPHKRERPEGLLSLIDMPRPFLGTCRSDSRSVFRG